MTTYIDTYVGLCSACSLDPTTIWNMRGFVIPSLQEEAQKYRAAASELPVIYLDRQWLEAEAEKLEKACRIALSRCQVLPAQQELFAA